MARSITWIFEVYRLTIDLEFNKIKRFPRYFLEINYKKTGSTIAEKFFGNYPVVINGKEFLIIQAKFSALFFLGNKYKERIMRKDNSFFL